jgi:hypothetical protein
MEEDEMGGACDTYRGEERCVEHFGGETWRKETIWNPKKQAGSAWAELIWIMYGPIGGLLWIR